MIPLLSISEFEEKFRQQPGKLLDVRTPGEYNAGHLNGAVNIDWLGGQVHSQADNLNKAETYYLYCASGNRSNQAAAYLKQLGFERVYNIGGYTSVMHADI